jgi:hypothetical protein
MYANGVVAFPVVTLQWLCSVQWWAWELFTFAGVLMT